VILRDLPYLPVAAGCAGHDARRHDEHGRVPAPGVRPPGTHTRMRASSCLSRSPLLNKEEAKERVGEERERERTRGGGEERGEGDVCVCMREGEREGEIGRDG
jgi:hypothetical protein